MPVLITADDLVEQAARDITEKTYTSATYDVDVLQALADAYVARGVLEPRTASYRTADVGVHPGQTQTITVAGRSISGTWLVTDVQIENAEGNRVERIVTAIEGDLYTGSWRDDLSEWSGGTSSASVSGSVTVVTGGGLGGTGTAGKLPKWATSLTLGDSIFSESGSVGTVTGSLNITSGLSSATQDLITRTGTLVSGATGAGFTVALSTSTITGNLPYARMPSGSGTWTGTPTITGTTSFTADANPVTNYTSNLGSLSKKYLTLHAAELWWKRSWRRTRSPLSAGACWLRRQTS